MFVPAMGGHDVACDFCSKHRCDEPVMFYNQVSGVAICTTCIKMIVSMIARGNVFSKKPALAAESDPIQFTFNKTPSPNGDSA